MNQYKFSVVIQTTIPEFRHMSMEEKDEILDSLNICFKEENLDLVSAQIDMYTFHPNGEDDYCNILYIIIVRSSEHIEIIHPFVKYDKMDIPQTLESVVYKGLANG